MARGRAREGPTADREVARDRAQLARARQTRARHDDATGSVEARQGIAPRTVVVQSRPLVDARALLVVAWARALGSASGPGRGIDGHNPPSQA